MVRSVNRTVNSPKNPILLDEAGKVIQPSFLPKELKLWIDTKYANLPPGRATRESEQSRLLKEAKQDEPLSPRFVLATLTGCYDVERPVAEMSNLGQWGSGFPNNRNKFVAYNSLHNDFPMPVTASKEGMEDQAKRMAVSYFEYGLVKPEDSFLDVGTSIGFLPKHLKNLGVKDVVAIEPDLENIKQRAAQIGSNIDEETKDTIQISAQEYLKSNDGRKFSVVNVSNIYPAYNCYENAKVDKSDFVSMMEALSGLTAKDGKCLVGVSSINPEYVSGQSGINLRQFLEKYFNKVEYISAKNFTAEYSDYFSVGGQMGVFSCAEPVGSAAPPVLRLLKADPSSPNAFVQQPNGDWAQGSVTVRDALAALEEKFSRRTTSAAKEPGPLTALLQRAAPGSELSADTVCGIFAARTMTGQDQLTERSTAEAGMLAQIHTHFIYSDAEILKKNRRENIIPQSYVYRNHREIGKRAAASYVQQGIIKPSDVVIDIGAGFGSMAKYLRKNGVANVVAIEPNQQFKGKIADDKAAEGKPIKPSKREELDQILPMTAEQYVALHPGKQFSVVNVSNFYPSTNGFKMMDALSALTAPGGKTLIGVCSVDPQDISNTSHNMKRQLEGFFDQVTYRSFEDFPEFREHFSVGAQLGYFECRNLLA